MRRLIINADDLGIASQRSHGIFQCHEHGVISSASLIPNFGDSDVAARHARERDLPTGLHINLTDGSPISRTQDISSLLTMDGYFLGRETFERCLREEAIERVQLEREVRSQLEWFLEHYGQPTHVDSHHHIHVHPVVAPVVVALLDRYGIAFVRIPSEPIPRLGFELEEDRKIWVEALSKQAEHARTLYSAHGIQSTQHFRGLALAGNASQKNFRHTLGSLEEGVTELMMHPGSANPSGGVFEADPQRATELNILMNPDTVEELRERKIELCSYGDLF